MKTEHYQKLVDGYLQKKLTKEELAIFFDLLSAGELEPYLQADMDFTEKEFSNPKQIQWRNYIKYAAILLVSGLVAVLAAKHFSPSGDKVLPGSEYAILTMADGTKMILDTNIQGAIQADNGLTVRKLDDGTMQYDLSSLKNSKTNDRLLSQYSELETPRGGIYQLVLSDGTKVWLNASSKIKFPLIFNNAVRTVEMEGEVYFEVARNQQKPFVVKSDGQEIKVLGTKFNVNAYKNEAITKTFLLEGSIMMIVGSENTVIKPGQLAQVKNGILVKDADGNQSVSWKDGYFDFDKLYVKEIMRQLERWYNIDAVYAASFKDERFVARIKTSADIEDIISIFNEGGLHVALNGRKLLVSNHK